MVKEYSTSGVKIAIVGVGGGGCNTIKRLIEYGLKGPELIAINTDRIHLDTIKAPAKKILIGQSITRGLGAGGYPDIAQRSAEASKPDIEAALSDVDLVFLVAGMGGGTGTGAAPVVADIAKKNGAIVVSVVTYPFRIERARLQKAKEGIENLKKVSDTLVIIDNQKLLDYVPNLPIEQTFMIADEITARAVRGISETLLNPSLINLDFADLTTIMTGGGISMIAVGEGKGISKVEEVVKNTLDHRLLDVDPKGAKGVLLHITGGPDMTLGDANTVGEMITAEVDPYANVIYGARMDQSYLGRIEVIAIFTGLKEGEALRAIGEEKKKKEERTYGDLWY
ncbi:MAG: cell division protein FtsZ [Candidatus Micrarchaeota archaeon]|nr:cell division protein FtsZ [Candidatus Micrarchaeota archaeon]